MNTHPLRSFVYGVLTAFLLSEAAARADDVVRHSWDKVSKYPTKGLSPLYDDTAEELHRILGGDNRWETLPRPINHIWVRSDQPPCFEMHNGDTYYNHMPENARAIRFAAEQAHDGKFRLLFNAVARGWHEDNLVVAIDGRDSELHTLTSNGWSTLAPLGSNRFGWSDRLRNPLRLAWAGNRSWWLNSTSGLFLFRGRGQKRAVILNWPADAEPAGVVGDRRGTAVVWSRWRQGEPTTVALYSDGRWTSVKVPLSERCTAAAIRTDRNVVLVGDRMMRVISPLVEDASPQTDDEVEHLRQGHVRVGEAWVQPYGAFAAAANGSAIHAGARIDDGVRGFVHLSATGDTRWIEFADAPRAQVAAMPGGAFVVLAPGKAVFRLDEDAPQLVSMASAEETVSADRLFGCDHRGRIYIKRGILGGAFLVLSPDGDALKAALPEFEAGMHSLPDHRLVGHAAAIDRSGTTWWVTEAAVNSSGERDPVRVMKLAEDGIPVSVEMPLTDPELLWPGRDGSMLIQNRDGAAALVSPDGSVRHSSSLIGLAQTSFETLRAAAPTRSHDTRQRSGQRYHPPWLTIGDSLWISDETEAAVRLRPVNDGEVEAHTIPFRKPLLTGPLRSGQLILMERGGSRISKWLKIEEPDGSAQAQPIGPLPKENGGGTLGQPDSYAGGWFLDSQGWLWLTQGFGRVYRVDAATEWTMLVDLGRPLLEFPAGSVWSRRHRSRVFPGYQVAGSESRRLCRPTFRQDMQLLGVHEEHLLFSTPLGLAWLKYDAASAENDAVVRTMNVAWGGTPEAFIGLHNDTLWMEVRHESRRPGIPWSDVRSRLVSVNLQESSP